MLSHAQARELNLAILQGDQAQALRLRDIRLA